MAFWTDRGTSYSGLCYLATQFTATNVKSKGLTVPRKHPIIHGDRKSMHYSTNFVCVCGRCTLIHAPAPGSTWKHELQKHLVKVELLGEPCRRAFLEIDIARSAACFASRTFQLTTTNMTWYWDWRFGRGGCHQMAILWATFIYLSKQVMLSGHLPMALSWIESVTEGSELLASIWWAGICETVVSLLEKYISYIHYYIIIYIITLLYILLLQIISY